MQRNRHVGRLLPTRRNRAALRVLTTALIVASSSFSCLPLDDRAYVIAVNFYTGPVSLRVGEEPGAVFAVDGLPPFGASALVAVRRTGDYPVLCKPAGLDAWQRLPDDVASAPCRLRAGGIIALIIDRRGFIRAFDCGDDPRPGARFCLVNATQRRFMHAAFDSPDAKSSAVFRTGPLEANTVTRFLSIAPGSYRLSVTPDASGPAQGCSAPSPREASLSLQDGTYWMILCYTRGDAIALEPVLLGTRENGRLRPATRD